MSQPTRQIEWTHRPGDTYAVTGTFPRCRSDKRFKIITPSHLHALHINLWKGSVWHLPADPTAAGYKRKLLKRVYN